MKRFFPFTTERVSQLTVLGAVTLALVAGVGCSDDASQPTNPETSQDDFGGYEATSEAPGFGDAELLSATEDEVDVTDEVGTDPETKELEDDPGTKTYAMTLRWGDLDRDPAGGIGGGGDLIDWSGSLRVSTGRLVLTRVLGFEPGDHTIAPRQDPQILEWVSETQGGSDGLTVLIHIPEDELDTAGDVVFLETAAIDLSWDLSELEEWEEIYEAGETGGLLRMNSMEARAVASIRGWLNGRWEYDEDAERGEFRGHWVHPRSGVQGFVRGHFAERKSDEAGGLGGNEAAEIAFYGKYIDRTGNFQGFLRGVVEVQNGDLADGAGVFRGGWFDEDADARGSVRGRWATGDAGSGPADVDGFFSGAWCLGCAPEAGD